jgi:hypothetical protein
LLRALPSSKGLLVASAVDVPVAEVEQTTQACVDAMTVGMLFAFAVPPALVAVALPTTVADDEQTAQA